MSATSTDPELPTRASEDLRYFVVPISVTLDTIAWRPEFSARICAAPRVRIFCDLPPRCRIDRRSGWVTAVDG